MLRKHASIRYNTADASFEVELEDVPAIFEVSHATGRCSLTRLAVTASCLCVCFGRWSAIDEHALQEVTMVFDVSRVSLELTMRGDTMYV